MADQKALGAYADEIVNKIVWAKINDSNVADLLFNGSKYAAREVLNSTIKSQVDGQDYPLAAFIGAIDRKLTEVLAKLDAKP